MDEATAAALGATKFVEANRSPSKDSDRDRSAMQAKVQGSAPPLSSQPLSSVK